MKTESSEKFWNCNEDKDDQHIILHLIISYVTDGADMKALSEVRFSHEALQEVFDSYLKDRTCAPSSTKVKPPM